MTEERRYIHRTAPELRSRQIIQCQLGDCYLPRRPAIGQKQTEPLQSVWPPLPRWPGDDPDVQALADSVRLAAGQPGRNSHFCRAIAITVKVPVLLLGALVFAGLRTRTANIDDHDSDRRKDGEMLLIEQSPPRYQETEILFPLARILRTCSTKNGLRLSSLLICERVVNPLFTMAETTERNTSS